MGHSREIYDKAIDILKGRKATAESQAEERLDIFYERCPKAKNIQKQISSTALETARVIFQRGNTSEMLQKLRDKNLALQNERLSLLKQYGFPVDYLTVKYNCSICNDTGFTDGKMCDCLKKLQRQLEYEKLNALTPLSLSTFETFSLSYYEANDRVKMENILNFTKKYALDFNAKSGSLLMSGGTGLGKTHLSLAIANETLKKGFGVIYSTAQNIALTIDNERFSNESISTHKHYTDCDLLIIDDLGTEFSTSYVTAAIYNIINTRLLSEKPTIINTNLSMRDLESRYTERFVSRIIGGYTIFTFTGKDIRQQKRLNNIKK